MLEERVIQQRMGELVEVAIKGTIRLVPKQEWAFQYLASELG